MQNDGPRATNHARLISGDWEVVCVSDGGRLNSVRWRGRDLLTRPHLVGGAFVRPSEEWGEYETRLVYGYDDCWPSLDPSPWPGVDREIRDHGELVYRTWDIRTEDDVLIARVDDPEAGWGFERRVRCVGDALEMSFACTNSGPSPLHTSWVGHALIDPASVAALRIPRFTRVRQAYPPVEGSDLLSLTTPDEVWAHLRSISMGGSIMMVFDGLDSCEFTVNTSGVEWNWRILGMDHPALALWYNRRQYPQPPELSRDEFGIEWMSGPEWRLDRSVEEGCDLIVKAGKTRRWKTEWRLCESPT